MKIAVDLDGVCYEWQRTYRYMLREYRGVQLPPVDQFWFSWNASDEFTTAADRKWIWSEGVRLGLFRHGHVWKGTILGIAALKQSGHELVVVTHRPRTAIRDTINWLDHHFGAMEPYPWSGINILSNGEPKHSIYAELLIDDKPENVIGWVDAGQSRKAIIFDQPWNREMNWHPRILRAVGWASVVDAVTNIDNVRSGAA